MHIHTYKLEEEDRYVDFRSYLGGVYFGDPCYVVPGWDDDVDLWDQLCNEIFKPVKVEVDGKEWTRHEERFDNRNNIRVVEVDGEKFYMWNTSYGDGCFPITLNDKVVDKL